MAGWGEGRALHGGPGGYKHPRQTFDKKRRQQAQALHCLSPVMLQACAHAKVGVVTCGQPVSGVGGRSDVQLGDAAQAQP